MTNSDYCDCPTEPRGIFEVDGNGFKRHIVCGKVLGTMTNSEQGAGECSPEFRQWDAIDYCWTHNQHYFKCEANKDLSALRAKVADLEKALEDKQAEVMQWRIEMDCFYTTIEKLARKMRAEFEIAKAQKNTGEINALSKVNDVILELMTTKPEALRPDQGEKP